MVTLLLTEDEFTALAGMLDAAVRATGLKSVKDAAALLVKLEIAAVQKEADRPSSE